MLSLFYSLGQISLGLILHPYQTVQMLVKDKIFEWLIVLPSGFLLALVLMWRSVITPVVRIFFTCAQANFLPCDLLPFLAHWIIALVILWQMMILYLWLRFHSVSASANRH